MTQPKLKQQTHVIVITSQNINYTKSRDIKEIKGFLFQKAHLSGEQISASSSSATTVNDIVPYSAELTSSSSFEFL